MSSPRPAPGITTADAKELLDALAARPRPAGGAAEGEARRLCAAALRDAGFVVAEEPFEFSAFPGRWATSIAGVAAIGVFVLAGHLAYRGAAAIALAVLVGALAAIAIGGTWLARRGVLDLPLMRQRCTNLVAERGAPAMWLVAHLDSKSQPVPILVRAAGITLGALAWITALGVAAAQTRGAALSGWWPWLTIAGVASFLPVAASTVGARSAGALDNASGCATVLLAALAHPRERPLGVLLTSAEELGLAGARAWVRGRPRGRAVNVDGVDDAGELTAMFTGGRPAALVETLAAAARREATALRPRRLLPGVLVDGVALADAGWDVVTISRGTLSTLGRIHTARDRRDRLRGEGIAGAARLIAATIREID